LRVKRRKTRRYNQHVGGRIVLDVCLPVETAEAIRVCAQVERYSISRVMSENARRSLRRTKGRQVVKTSLLATFIVAGAIAAFALVILILLAQGGHT
jgi:hypothetical protein